MLAMAETTESQSKSSREEDTDFPLEGDLRTMGKSGIRQTLQVPEIQELVTFLSNRTERAGFEPG